MIPPPWRHDGLKIGSMQAGMTRVSGPKIQFCLLAILLAFWSRPAAAQELWKSLGDLCDGRCAATIFAGVQNETSQARMFGAKAEFTPPWEYQFSNGYFLGGTLSRELWDLNGIVAIEAELGLGQRFGTLHETEVWGAAYLRWKYFPWNNYLRTTVAVSTGVNYASSLPDYEIVNSGNGRGSKALHYFSPEITFALSSNPDTELVIRNHHRSGGAEWWGAEHPIYGTLFRNTYGGVQYLSVGLRQRF